MKTGILDAGNVGTRVADLAKAAGHDVVVENRTGEFPPADAAKQERLVIVAIHYHAVANALPSLASTLAGRIVVDATNPPNDDWSPDCLDRKTLVLKKWRSLSAMRRWLKHSTRFADGMMPKTQGREGQKITAFIARNDDHAVEQVVELARSISFTPTTVSTLSAAR
ncbi:MAG: NAD(P)-binding domain-containing protein [Pseudomonadota bacterium]